MNIHISGAGTVAPGEYEEVHVSGSADMTGPIRCAHMHVSGSADLHGDLDCAQDVHVSGALDIKGGFRADSAKISGALDCGPAEIRTSLRVSGGMHVHGALTGGELKFSGGLQVDGGIEAERFISSGALECQGLVNADTVEITLWHDHSTVGAIGGSRIVVTPANEDRKGLARVMKLFAGGGTLNVRESIEGDEITLEQVTCPVVSGNNVAIGPGCHIDLVRCSGTLAIHPDAEVKATEQV